MIYLCVGRRGQGKTTLGYFISSRVPRRLIFDPRGLVQTPGAHRVTTAGGMFAAVDAFLDGELVEIVFTPDGDVNAAFQSFCNYARRIVRETPDEPLAILVDEIRFVDLQSESLDWILRCSPVDTVHVIFTGHRPKDVPTDIRAIADKWLLFQFTLSRDLDVIAEQTSDAVARGVQKLNARQFIEWDDARGKARYFNDASRWYIPLGVTRPARASLDDAIEGGEDARDDGQADLPLDT